MRRVARTGVGLLLACALPAVGAPARVRLTLADGSVLEGELLRHLDGEYRLRVDGAERTLPEDGVRAAEVLTEDDARLRLDVRARPLGEVARELGRQVGRTVRVTASRAQEPLTLRLGDVSWLEALRVVARVGGCDVEPDGTAWRLRPLVQLSVRDLPAQWVVVHTGSAAEQPIEVAREVSGRVTLQLDGVPLRCALDALSWTLALGVDRGGDPWKVTRQPQRPPFVAWGGPRWGIAEELPEGHPVTLDMTGRTLQETCEAIASMARVHLLVHPDVPPLAVNLRVQGVSWREAVREVVRQAGCRVETLQGLVLVTRPRGVVRAIRAPPGPLLVMLAKATGRGVVVAPEVRGLLGFEMHGVDAREAIHRLAHSVGWQVVLVDDQVFAVGGEELAPDTPPDPPFPMEGDLTVGSVTIPRPRFQAVIVGCGEDRALIDGIEYGEGDALLTRAGGASGLRVERIGSDGLDLVAGEARQRLPLGP